MKLTLHVYLPAGHDRKVRLPTAYILGGDPAREVGRVPDLLDRLIPSRVEPLIAVFLGPVDWGGPGPAYGEEEQAVAAIVAKDVVAFVDARYPTRAEPASRAAVGGDLDGVAAAFVAFAHPSLFGGLGTHSMALEDPWQTELQQHIRTAEAQPLRLYLDWARYDARATREKWDARRSALRFVPFLRERGYRPAGGEAPDGAGWASWRNRTYRLFETLFPARARAGSD